MSVLTSRFGDTNTDWLFGLISAVLAGSILTWALFATQSTNKEFWKSQAWVGIRNEWFATLRANVRSLKGIRSISKDGYNKFSRNGHSFAVPVFGSEPWIVLPPSATKELLNKPDAEVDAEPIHEEQIQRRYTQGHMGALTSTNPLHIDVVRRQLTRKLPLLTADVLDELRIGFEAYWGNDTRNSKRINVYRTCVKIVSRAANRVFVRDQLCRNDKFLDHCRMYSEGIFGGAALINLIPKVLHPLVAPIIMYPNRKNERICMQACMPIVKDRLYHTTKKNHDATYKWTPPVDALQWLVEDCLKTGDPKELDPKTITFRLLELNMVAIHTTSMTITNAILDLYSSPDVEKLLEGLREECERVGKQYDGMWSKQAINELFRVDSTIRESMRVSDLGWLAINRMVTAPGGVTFQDNIHVPQGVRVCIPAHAIHRDETLYPSPLQFDAFRFSRPREEKLSQMTEGKMPADSQENIKHESWRGNLDLKNVSAINTSDDFLAFGHGRHACPGRFFATQELKLMLAHLVMHYDIEPLSERPEPSFMNGFSIPLTDTWINIKRRRE